MITAMLALGLGACLGALLGCIHADRTGAELVPWGLAGAGCGAVLFWALLALLKVVLRTLFRLVLGGLLGAGLGYTLLHYWPEAPLPQLPLWAALVFAGLFLCQGLAAKESQ